MRRSLILAALALLLAGCADGASDGPPPPPPPDATGPATAVTAPLAGAFLRGSAVALSASATDGSGVSQVEFFTTQGGSTVSRGVDIDAPFAVTLDSTTLVDAAASVFAVAGDALGNTATSTAVSVTVDNTAPSSTLTAPTAGAIAGAAGLGLSATAADSSGVARVEFFVTQGGPAQKIGEDGSHPYATTFDIYAPALTLVDGAATLAAVATDAAGWTTASAPVPISITEMANRPTVFTSGPTIVPNPNTSVPLAAIVSFRTSVPTRATFTISDGARTLTAAFDDLVTIHEHALLGFRPARSHAISIEIESTLSGSASTVTPLVFNAPPLPADFPPIDVLVSDPARMEPGVRVLTCSPNGGPGFRNFFVALDAEGDVVWYRQHQSGGDFERTPAGTLVYIEGSFDLVEIDMLGNEVTRWHATRLRPQVPAGSVPVDCDTFHHEVSVLPSGNLVALSSEMRTFTGYPTSDSDPSAPSGTANVVSDVVVEFQRDGTVLGRWSMLDLIDPYRIGYGSLGGFWNGPYQMITRDWSHGNAIAHDARDDSFSVSLRHQDAVVKFSRAGQLVWILGTGANWNAPWSSLLLTPEAGTEFQYHQHAVKWLPNGNLMLFDNGNFRASPFDPKVPAASNYSRAVELSVDEQAMTFGEAWVYGGPGDEIFYSPFICDSDRLPVTGNVLVTDGGHVVDANGNPLDTAQGHVSARIAEVTHTSPPEKVFEVVIDDTSAAAVSWQVYRAELFPSLYP